MDFRDQVAALEARYLDAYHRRDAAPCADVYTEDAIYLVPDQDPVRGRKAIAEATAREIASGLQLKRLEAFHTESSGDLGYALENFSSSVGDGTVMLAYRRDKRGAWLICAEAFLVT
jgi:ketosteroid isomerase-like protein